MSFIKMSSFRLKNDLSGQEFIIALDGKNIKIPLVELAQYIAPFVPASVGAGYIAVNGTVLPVVPNDGFTIVSAGTFTQTNGADITTTELLNVLSTKDGVWTLTKGIPLNLINYVTKREFNDLKFGIEKNISNAFLEFDLTLGYINLSGVVLGEGTDANWEHTDFIKVTPGDVISYANTDTPNNVLQVSFYNENKVFISGVVGGTNGNVTVPNNTYFARYCKQALTSNSVVSGLMGVYIVPIIERNSEKVDEFKDEFNNGIEENILNVFFDLPNYYGYINLSGVVLGEGTDKNWRHTDFLRVKKGSNIVYQNTQTPNNVLQVSFYDENKALISGVVGGTNGSIAFPFGAVYVRFCCINYGSPLGSCTIVFSILEELQRNSDAIDKKQDIEKKMNYVADVNMFIQYGQSLSQGDWENKIILSNQKYNSLMFTGGIRVWENRNQSTKYNALIPAIESVFEYLPGETVVGAPVRGETPACGSADKIVELIRDEDGLNYDEHQYQLLISAPGMGGTGIDSLSDLTGIYFTRLMADVAAGKALADAANKSFYVAGVTWLQGEYDTYYDMSESDYYNKMVLLFNNLNAYIKSATGQTQDVHFFLYQTACFDYYFGGKFTYPDVSLAQLRIALTKPNVHMASPIYHLPLLGDFVHFTAEGSHWFGGYLGIAYKRAIIDNENFKPIHVIDKKVVGNIIYLKFHAPVYPLRFDTTSVPDKGVSKGFQIRNPNDRNQNSFLNIITNVEINKFDTIKITCSSNPVGKKLTYAINGTGTSNISGGNLRDSQSIKFNFPAVEGGADVEHDMFNFCPLFELIL